MFGRSPRLFISYSRQDSAFAEKLEAALTKRGFTVFRDTSGISPGENFVSTIKDELGEARP
jgi:hypothetical protein